jgi:hypothetical protein
MPDGITVELARVADRESVMTALRDRGLEVREGDGTVIEIPCGPGEQQRLCDEVIGEVEAWIAEAEVPLVPEVHEDRVVLRPPAS